MKGQEVKKESVLGAIKKYQAEDKEKPTKKQRDKFTVGVVLGLHRLFFYFKVIVAHKTCYNNI